MAGKRQVPRKRSPGRQPGHSGTRDAILDAALEQFARHGVDGTSMRAVAAAAGVDPALVRHYFGDKQGLFAATVAHRTVIPQRIAEALLGDPTGIGVRASDVYLSLWEDADTGPMLLALARSASTSSDAAAMLAEVLDARVRGIDATPTNAGRRTQVVLAAAHLFGLAFARHVVKMPQIADLSHDELVALVAPAIQQYLSPRSA